MSTPPAPTPPAAGPVPPAEPFGARLRRAMDTRGPLCVGIDPHAALLGSWGLADDVAGLERFTRTVVDALADRVAVLKPQSAFFERFGSRGVAVLERAVADARAAGALVLMDAKRGDIGSTMGAYAAAYLDPAGPLFSDAVTVSPYLGFGSLRPALDAARACGSGVFVLALTSNPEGPEVQRATVPDGRTLAQVVLDHLARENAGQEPLGSFGAVVGATLGEADADLAIGGPLLAPGLGAQGASAADLPRVFGAAVRDVVPSVSRGILRHGPGPRALREAAHVQAQELAAVLG
ncbi:orotidine-5'-phosphate decarboxylase [Streptomyces sp. TRM 70351]|uniref:orotidine-5'-phosphate decarboxylase n=1 Tax=Streptomyces sp. TRM 70351 TaxID=3116552 RepID=UPI002E7C4E23|nr:orotidine-5'-phosphate decarboxylase [Streptomyces sp. TRM 70351]MEE1929044.1 orotidine-5'-phosphate decarboxylase [Streptomyces sp. TRM 70351]